MGANMSLVYSIPAICVATCLVIKYRNQRQKKPIQQLIEEESIKSFRIYNLDQSNQVILNNTFQSNPTQLEKQSIIYSLAIKDVTQHLLQNSQSEHILNQMQLQNQKIQEKSNHSLNNLLKIISNPIIHQQKQQLLSIKQAILLAQKNIQQEFKFTLQQNQQTQNETVIQSNNLDIQKLDQSLKQKFQKSKIVKVEVTTQDKLRVGNGQSVKATIKIQIQQKQFKESIKNTLKDLKQAFKVTKNINNQMDNKLITFVQQFQKIQIQIDLMQKCDFQPQNENVDVIIVMDTTQSMNPFLQQAKKTSNQIIRKFKEKYNKAIVRLGFVSFKDHQPPNNPDDQPIPPQLKEIPLPVFKTFQLNQNVQQIQQAIFKQIPKGGYDFPQAIHCALKAAGQMFNNQKAQKYVILITDAPPHGIKYYNGFDNFKDGCPCKVTLTQIKDLYTKQRINLCFKAVTNLQILQATNQIFKQHFLPTYYEFSQLTSNIQYVSQAVDFLVRKKQQFKLKQKDLKIKLTKMEQCIIKETKKQIQKHITRFQSASSRQKAQKFLRPYLTQIDQIQQKLNKNTNINSIISNITKLSQIKIEAKKIN